MLEDLAGPNRNIHFLVPNATNGLERTISVRKGYRRGYTEFGEGHKLHPERYRNGPIYVLSKEEIEALYLSTKL